MAPLGALTAAWTAAEAALPLGWRLVGVVHRERALRLLVALRDQRLPDWCALAEDEALALYDAWGEHQHQALLNLSTKLRRLRGSTTG